MKIEHYKKNGNFGMAIIAGGAGSCSILQGLTLSNSYLIGFGGALIVAGAINIKNSCDSAQIIDASIEELSKLNEIRTNYFCEFSGEEKEFIGTIEKFSDYDVKNVRGQITNIRTTGFVFKDMLADLVDENGVAIPCIFPMKTKLKDGQNLNLSAYLRKITMPNKNSKTGLIVYSVS